MEAKADERDDAKAEAPAPTVAVVAAGPSLLQTMLGDFELTRICWLLDKKAICTAALVSRRLRAATSTDRVWRVVIARQHPDVVTPAWQNRAAEIGVKAVRSHAHRAARRAQHPPAALAPAPRLAA